jgi:molybdate transport system substrate-binding protein
MTQQLTGLSSMATRQILNDLAGLYEQRTGTQVVIRSMGGVEVARVVRAGEPADVIILAAKAIEQLEAEGHVVPESRVGFARSGMAIATPRGAQRPDIGDEAAVKHAILNARGICYSTGPSGNHLIQLIERWGIAGSVVDRLIQAPPGVPVGTMLADGKADLGFQQLSELLHVPGIEVVGPLPPGIQSVTVFAAGVSKVSYRANQARALIAYLTSPEAEAAKRQHGMEPA